MIKERADKLERELLRYELLKYVLPPDHPLRKQTLDKQVREIEKTDEQVA